MAFHKDLGDNQIHRLYDQVYASDAARDADTTWNGDSTNVGKAVLVTSDDTVFMLVSITPSWFEFGGTTTGIDTIYNADSSIIGDRTVTAPSGRNLFFKSYDLLSSNFTLGADIDIINGEVDIEAFTGDGAGGINAISRLLINTSTMQILDQINSIGLVYGADYSANFTARSLIDKGYADANSLYKTDSDISADRTVTAPSGRFLLLRSQDLLDGTFTKRSDFSTHEDEIGIESQVGNGSGGISSLSRVLLNNTKMEVLDTTNNKGLVNAADYSANFTARSLVDKAYVDTFHADEVVNVWTEADFGTAVASIITLVAGTSYHIMDSFSLSSQLKIPTGGSVQIRTDNRSHVVTFTHASLAMFAGVNIGTLALLDCVFDGNSTGTLLDIGGGVLSFKFPDFNSWDSMGTVSDLTDFFAPGMFIDTSTGLNMIDCASCTIYGHLGLISTSGAALFIISGASSGDLQFYNGILDASNANNSMFNIVGASFPTTQTVNIGGNNIVNGVMFHGSSIDQTDDRVISRGNKGAPDSTATAVGTAFNQAGVATTINATDETALVNATFTSQSVERFTVTSAGIFQHDGTQAITAQVIASITGQNTSGTDVGMSFYLGKGQFGQAITAFADAGGGTVTVTTSLAHGYSNGDRVNILGTTNYNGGYTISGVTSTTFVITATWVATETGWAPRLILEHTKASNSFSNVDKNTMLIAQVDLSEDQFLQIFVENNSTTVNWETSDINMTIAKI